MNKLTFLDFRHFAFLIGLFTTYLAVADLIFEHWIIAGTRATEFITGDNMPDIDQDKRNTEDAKNNR